MAKYLKQFSHLVTLTLTFLLVRVALKGKLACVHFEMVTSGENLKK